MFMNDMTVQIIYHEIVNNKNNLKYLKATKGMEFKPLLLCIREFRAFKS